MILDSPLTVVPNLLGGALVTIEVTLASALLALVVAFIAALGRLSRFVIVRFIALVYIEIFRGTSVLVQLYFWFYVLPLFGVELAPFPTGVLGLGLNVGAYAAEMVRGAIVSVDRGQTDAAVALNMPRRVIFRRVILPQALPVMVPPLGNALVDLLKTSSLVAFITITDLTFAGRLITTLHGHVVEVYSAILIIYFIIALVLGALVSRVIEPLVGRWRTAQ